MHSVWLVTTDPMHRRAISQIVQKRCASSSPTGQTKGNQQQPRPNKPNNNSNNDGPGGVNKWGPYLFMGFGLLGASTMFVDKASCSEEEGSDDADELA